MEDIRNAFYGMNASIVLWVAVSLAALFVLVIAYDTLVRRRNAKKKRRGGSDRSPGFFKRMQLLQQSVRQEVVRRRRHAQRARDREH